MMLIVQKKTADKEERITRRIEKRMNRIVSLGVNSLIFRSR